MKDEDLIRLLQQQDPQGLEALQLRYTPLLHYIVAPILPDKRDQEECVSEILMRVWEKASLYTPEKGSWGAWLTALARNAALNRARTFPAEAPSPLSSDIPTSAPTPEEVILQQEQQTLLERTIQRLDSKDRMLFYRKYYYRQSTAQIARELSMTERAVEGRLYRLKQRLRVLMGGDSRA